MTKVRTTFFPDTVLEIADNELLDLTRQGLIAEVLDQPQEDNPPDNTVTDTGTENS